VDPVRLQTFADTHRNLLDEARRTAQSAAS
jgi:hypothetical protein